ncbi:hypothetical protein SO802_030807 [Lithocarpus litseifolius]|uniref:Uncharacterized protein n=1 Tax=Lithocarpus litseifolius TaxID=425828 RepID=A0AAW2BKJ8_9ROSI
MPKSPRSGYFLVFLSSDPAKIYSPPSSDPVVLAQIHSNSAKIYSPPSSDLVVLAQIHSNPAKIYSPPSSDLLKSGDICLDLTQINEDRLRSAKIDSDLLESGAFNSDRRRYFLSFLAVEIGEWAWVRWRSAIGFVTDASVGQVV